MKVKLYGIPGSHNVAIAEAMLRHKGIEYSRRDLVPGTHLPLVRRVLGFSGGTVPALRAGERRFHGAREISRGLDEPKAEPPLFPSDPSSAEYGRARASSDASSRELGTPVAASSPAARAAAATPANSVARSVASIGNASWPGPPTSSIAPSGSPSNTHGTHSVGRPPGASVPATDSGWVEASA